MRTAVAGGREQNQADRSDFGRIRGRTAAFWRKLCERAVGQEHKRIAGAEVPGH